MSAFNLTTHLGAYLFRENHFNTGGLVGSVALEVLDGYIDASGQEKTVTDKILTVNGLLSTPTKWQEFDDEWQPYLKGQGFKPDPETDKYVFHASPFWNDSCPLMPDNLKRWDKENIYWHLIGLIRKHTVYRFGYGVLLNDFRKIEEEFPHVRRSLLRKPGTKMSLLCVKWNAIWAKYNNYNTAISYIFDRGDKFFPELYEGFRHAEKKAKEQGLHLSEVIGSLTEGNKARYSPLQAADILAWECRQYFQQLLVNGEIAPFAHLINPRKELMRLNVEGESALILYNREHLKEEILEAVEGVLTDERREKLIGDGKPYQTVDDLARGLFELDISRQVEAARTAQAHRKGKSDTK